MANLEATEVLREIVTIYGKAKNSNIPTPTHIDNMFRMQLYSTYMDKLSAERIDKDSLGHLLGNKARWKSEFCKFFTLHFLKFLMDKSPQTATDSSSLTAIYSNGSAEDEIWLRVYDVQKFSPDYVMNGPTLFIGDVRTIAIKAKVKFPNVYKARESRNRDQYMYKWLNMRYDLLSNGGVKLLPFPNLRARAIPGTRNYTTRGIMADLPGEIVKFSYCQLASTILDLGRACLKMLVDPNVSPLEFDKIRLVIRLVNLIRNRNTPFELIKPDYTKQSSQRVLFPDMSAKGTESIRLNGEDRFDNVYMYCGSLESINEILGPNSVSMSTFVTPLFDKSTHNIYGNLEEDEDLYVLLFETEESPEVQYGGIAEWSQFPNVTEYDILTEDDLLDLFTSDD